MSGIIIGTAGHIDHGKTTLIRLLTGQDTDGLPEEKKRGISIDLGFAWLEMPDKSQIGIIDVPGHERFISNMLAGSAHLDIALLIIAADEGIMPQTREHAAILDLLNVRQGIIVLTKADLVDKQWMQMLQTELRDFFSETIFADAPIMEVSSVNMYGISKLKECIFQIARQLQQEQTLPNASDVLYFPIDRVFSVPGFGTVATGTIHSGRIDVGDHLEIMPQQIRVRVRGIQMHGCAVESAESGQRAGVNIVGAAAADFKRGSVLVLPGQLQLAGAFVGRFRLCQEQAVLQGVSCKIRVYIGTDEITGRLRMLEKDEMSGGETMLVQVMLDKQTVVKAKLGYIIRSWDMQRTIGGGEIISPVTGRLKRLEETVLEKYRVLESGDIRVQLQKEIAGTWVWQANGQIISAPQQEMLNLLQSSGWVIALDNGIFTAKHKFEEFAGQVENLLSVYHNGNPVKDGMTREQLRRALPPEIGQKAFNYLLERLVLAGTVKRDGGFISLVGFNPEFTGVWGEIRGKINREISQTPFSPPSVQQIRTASGSGTSIFNDTMAAMIKAGELVEISEGMIFRTEEISAMRHWLTSYFTENATVAIADMRNAFLTSRKYLLPLFEYFDRQGVTCREGDHRIAGIHGKIV